MDHNKFHVLERNMGSHYDFVGASKCKHIIFVVDYIFVYVML